MKDQYYLKDKKAEIYKQGETVQDEDGFDITEYKKVSEKPLWCYARQLSQEQTFSAASYGEEETRLFVFNYRNDVELYDFIRYRGAWYRITRVDTRDDYKGELFIYVRNCKNGEIPDIK